MEWSYRALVLWRRASYGVGGRVPKVLESRGCVLRVLRWFWMSCRVGKWDWGGAENPTGGP